jgi:hypothetical protein
MFQRSLLLHFDTLLSRHKGHVRVEKRSRVRRIISTKRSMMEESEEYA